MANCDDPLPAKYRADPNGATVHVDVAPNTEWTETPLSVRRGERLLFVATGTVWWGASNTTTTADGYDGTPGWHVGRGGLVGRVGADGKLFEIGAREGLFPDKHPRPPHHPYPPPPIEMPRDGRLYLGFKEFTPGANAGAFAVGIARVVPIRR
jgi:hypothetical protein